MYGKMKTLWDSEERLIPSWNDEILSKVIKNSVKKQRKTSTSSPWGGGRRVGVKEWGGITRQIKNSLSIMQFILTPNPLHKGRGEVNFGQYSDWVREKGWRSGLMSIDDWKRIFLETSRQLPGRLWPDWNLAKKMESYLSDHTLDDLKKLFKKAKIKPLAINSLNSSRLIPLGKNKTPWISIKRYANGPIISAVLTLSFAKPPATGGLGSRNS